MNEISMPKPETVQDNSYMLTVAGNKAELNIKATVLNKITTGGTNPIDVIQAHLITNNAERQIGKYIVKHEYYPGEATLQEKSYQTCKEAGLPVPNTLRVATKDTGDPALLITYLKPDGGDVWSLNDAKARALPTEIITNKAVIDQMHAISEKASANGIELNAYAFMVVSDKDGHVAPVIGDFGDTEVKIHSSDSPESNQVASKNSQAVDIFLKRAGFVEDKTPPAPPISISL